MTKTHFAVACDCEACTSKLHAQQYFQACLIDGFYSAKVRKDSPHGGEFDIFWTDNPDEVTCGACKRTLAYRKAKEAPDA